RAYTWPGNVRELEHAIERVVALARSPLLLPEDLPADVPAQTARAPELPPNRMTLVELKRWYVALVLDEARGNNVRAAELLGIDPRTLYRMLERGDDPEDYRRPAESFWAPGQTQLAYRGSRALDPAPVHRSDGGSRAALERRLSHNRAARRAGWRV